MSANISCPHCYKTNAYTSTAPKFCGFCGKSFLDAFDASGTVTQQEPTIDRVKHQKNQSNRPKVIIEQNDDEIDNNNPIPQIDKIEIIVEGNLRPNRDKFENVINTGALGISRPKNNPNQKGRPKNISKEEIKRGWTESFPKTRSVEIGGGDK